MLRTITSSVVLSALLLSIADANGEDELTYAKATSPLYYRLTAEAEFGPKQIQKYEASLVYKIEPRDEGGLEIYDKRIVRPQRFLSYRSNVGFYRLERSFFTGGTSVPTLIDVQGKLLEVRSPVWMMGLPVDLSRIAFPPIDSSDNWVHEEPVSLIRSYNGTLQLASVAPQIKGRSRSFVRAQDQTDSVFSVARTTYEVADRDKQLITIKETLELDGSQFAPQVSLSATGTIVFSKELGSVDSINRSYMVKWREPNRQLNVPIKVSLTRFTDEDMKVYEAELKERADRTAKIRAEQEAMRQQLPDLSDKDAVLAVLDDSSTEVFAALIAKMHSEKLSDDRELGMACYMQLFRRARQPSSIESVIVRLAPDLEKTTDLAEEYSGTYSSFKIGMTGDSITAETKLTKDQIICYRDTGSSFHAGHLYGAVEDVLVIRTRATQPKLLAIKRENCRLPVKDFIDPALLQTP